MKKNLITLLIAFTASISCFAQTPTPTPKPKDENEIKITTSLIQIDVTVTDKKGKLVTDLKPEEVEIFENKDKQAIANFSFVEMQSDKSAPPNQNPENSSILFLRTPIKPENVRRTIALVIDDLHISFESMKGVQTALRNFVEKQMQETDLVAIVRTGGGSGVLQQFTSDKRRLFAAIERVRWNAQGISGSSPFAPIEASMADVMYNVRMRANPNDAEENERLYKKEKALERENTDFHERFYAGNSLNSLISFVAGMAEIPGRKSVILMSEGFAIQETNRDNLPTRNATIYKAFTEMIEMANRSSISVYTMDVRGLQRNGLAASDNNSEIDSRHFQQYLVERFEKFRETQEVLRQIARDTGGKAILNTNDLSGGLGEVLDDQKGYYLIGYVANEDSFDPKTHRLNKLTVKVNRPDVNVRYRSEFFGTANEDNKTVAVANLTPQQRMSKALFSPFTKNEINLNLNAIYADDPKIGAYIRPILFIDTKDLKVSDEPDGKHKASFEVVALTFDLNGKVVNETAKGYSLAVTNEQLKYLVQNGLSYNFILPIKNPGAYSIRVGLRDVGSDKIGSASQFIEIPDLKKKQLALSSIFLENASNEDGSNLNDILAANSIRQFSRGSTFNFGLEIYNSLLDKQTQLPKLEMEIRLYRNGKQLGKGNVKAISLENQTDLKRLKVLETIKIGKLMETGDYLLEVYVKDTLAKDDAKIAKQIISFEVVN